MQGIKAEKNKMDEMATVPATNLEATAPFAISNAGRNISARPVAEAFATRRGSGNCARAVKG